MKEFNITQTKGWHICYIVFCVISIIVCTTLETLYNKNRDNRFYKVTSDVLTPVVIFIIFLYSSLKIRWRKEWYVSIALLLCFIAEVLQVVVIVIDWAKTNLPNFALMPFVISHIIMVIYYFRTKSFSKNDLLKLIPFLVIDAALLTVYYWNARRLGTFNVAYAVLVPLYAGLLTLIAWRGVCCWKNIKGKQIAQAALFFFISDWLVIIRMSFHADDQPAAVTIILWVTYLSSVCLMATFIQPTFESLHFESLHRKKL